MTPLLWTLVLGFGAVALAGMVRGIAAYCDSNIEAEEAFKRQVRRSMPNVSRRYADRRPGRYEGRTRRPVVKPGKMRRTSDSNLYGSNSMFDLTAV